MTHNANIYTLDDSLHVEISAGYGDSIELRTDDDLLELLRDLIAAGNAHFSTTARLVEASGEVNAGQLLSDDIRIAPGDYPPINFDDHSHRTLADELSPLHWFGRENDGSQLRQDYTWQDFRREHLAQFEATVAALKPEPEAPYTWAEYQAANKQALDEIADFVGGTR